MVYLTGRTDRTVRLPGLTLKFMKGPLPLPDDPNFLSLKAASLPRALLENLSSAHARNRESKTLAPEDLEAQLERRLHLMGASELNRIRVRAREIAKRLHWNRQFSKLDRMIGALLGSRPVRVLRSPQGKARALGLPYDPSRIRLFDVLFAELRHFPFHPKSDVFRAPDHRSNKAFFEAYFSNYIEGTVFEIAEAEEIVFDRRIPKGRPADVHDILGTFRIVSDPNEMKRVPTGFDEFESLLKDRHRMLMENRPEIAAGHYKDMPNRAGSTHFVDPEYVQGTLEKGFRLYLNLPTGMARAIYMTFLLSEVHPFRDGNGRIARIFMNAELFSGGLSTILIPTVCREDYLGALRAMSRRERPSPLVDMLTRAQDFSHLEYSPYADTLRFLEAHNWFREPEEAKLMFP